LVLTIVYDTMTDPPMNLHPRGAPPIAAAQSIFGQLESSEIAIIRMQYGIHWKRGTSAWAGTRLAGPTS
jgi:hypothetical protein